MALFQVKIGWKMSRMRKYKNYRSVSIQPDAKQKIPKKQQKKFKKYRYGFISSQKYVGKGGARDKIKIIITFRSYPTRNLKFQKNSNKIQKF